jgi:hypothetical protein
VGWTAAKRNRLRQCELLGFCVEIGISANQYICGEGCTSIILGEFRFALSFAMVEF